MTVDGPIKINVKDNARLITTHITVAPGGHTAWHFHPGPHFVSVQAGEVRVYEPSADGSDCPIRGDFPANTGFFDPGSTSPSHVQTSRDVHMLKNIGAVPAEVVIFDIRQGSQPKLVNVSPQPGPCHP